MANVLDYLDWRGDLTLEQSPSSHVDSLILCRLSYLPFDGILPGLYSNTAISIFQAAERLLGDTSSPVIQASQEKLTPRDAKLLQKLAQSRRFSQMTLCKYTNSVDSATQKQFSALTVHTNDGCLYVAYRGTDSTLVGWKEDFNMSFITPVPSQRDAVSYLEHIAHNSSEQLRVGGHSKGGNLAIYAAAFSSPSIQSRILQVDSHDGPGFLPKVMYSAGYQAVRPKITTFLPQSSVIGMLLEHEEEYIVVQSSQRGLMQHDLYSWNVMADDFIRLHSITKGSHVVDKTLKEWIAQMNVVKREQLVDGLFQVLSASGAHTISDLKNGRHIQAALAMISAMRQFDPATKYALSQTFRSLFQLVRKNAPLMFFNRSKNK